MFPAADIALSMQLLYEAMAADLKRELKAKKAELMAKLADMPDSQLQARRRLLVCFTISVHAFDLAPGVSAPLTAAQCRAGMHEMLKLVDV